MWLMLAETRRMCVRVTGKGGRGRKLIFITPEKLLMMRDTRFLTRDGHQVTIMSHGSHTCHHVTISWGNIFLVCLCQIRSFSKWVFLCSRKASLYFLSNLLHVLIRSPKFFKRILFLMAGIKWHMRLLQTPTRCSQPGLVNSLRSRCDLRISWCQVRSELMSGASGWSGDKFNQNISKRRSKNPVTTLELLTQTHGGEESMT